MNSNLRKLIIGSIVLVVISIAIIWSTIYAFKSEESRTMCDILLLMVNVTISGAVIIGIYELTKVYKTYKSETTYDYTSEIEGDTQDKEESTSNLYAYDLTRDNLPGYNPHTEGTTEGKPKEQKKVTFKISEIVDSDNDEDDTAYVVSPEQVKLYVPRAPSQDRPDVVRPKQVNSRYNKKLLYNL